MFHQDKLRPWELLFGAHVVHAQERCDAFGETAHGKSHSVSAGFPQDVEVEVLGQMKRQKMQFEGG